MLDTGKVGVDFSGHRIVVVRTLGVGVAAIRFRLARLDYFW